MPTKQMIQRDVVVREDLAPYRGRWIAVRDGKIVADADDAIELRDDPRVRSTDFLLPVPRETNELLIL